MVATLRDGIIGGMVVWVVDSGVDGWGILNDTSFTTVALLILFPVKVYLEGVGCLGVAFGTQRRLKYVDR